MSFSICFFKFRRLTIRDLKSMSFTCSVATKSQSTITSSGEGGRILRVWKICVDESFSIMPTRVQKDSSIRIGGRINLPKKITNFSMQDERDDYSAQLARHISERKRSREEVVCDDYVRYAPSRKCKWGKACREIDVCSYYHGDCSSLANQFCSCKDIGCLKPHPNRAKKVARRKIDHYSSNSTDTRQQRLVCKKCRGPHRITECPDVQCFQCKRWGHMPGSSICLMK